MITRCTISKTHICPFLKSTKKQELQCLEIMKSKLFLHHLHLQSVFNFNLIDYSAREGRESANIQGGGIDASQLEMLNEMIERKVCVGK